MISEKTVELNVTAELLNWLYRQTGVTHTAIGPSQSVEGRLGYDVHYHGHGIAALIQFKRAYVNKTDIWEWRLNHTAKKDQHWRLQKLEQHVSVFYAFPYFCTVEETAKKRMQLLTSTFWFKPSTIKPHGGPTGYHSVRYDPSSGRWWVTSRHEVELPQPLRLGDITAVFTESAEPVRIEEVEAALNDIMLMEEADTNVDTDSSAELDSALSGQALILALPE